MVGVKGKEPFLQLDAFSLVNHCRIEYKPPHPAPKDTPMPHPTLESLADPSSPFSPTAFKTKINGRWYSTSYLLHERWNTGMVYSEVMWWVKQSPKFEAHLQLGHILKIGIKEAKKIGDEWL